VESPCHELTAADWAAALLERLLPEGRAGCAVVLCCDDDAVADAGSVLGVSGCDAPAALAAAVRSAGGLFGAARAARRFGRRSGKRPVPDHLAALGLLTLASSRMGDDGSPTQAYYARLATLVGPPDSGGHPPYGGFAELCERGFAALAHWLESDQEGERGDLALPAEPWPRWVGTPISQVALRAADRRRLDVFFAERSRQLDAGWDPAGTLAHHPARHQLTRPARLLLADPRRRPLLSAALRAARSAWDGSTVDPDGRRVLAGSLFAVLDPLAGGLRLTLRIDGLEGAAQGRGPDGRPVSIPAPPATLEVPLAWLRRASEGPALIELSAKRAVRVLPGPLVLFEVGPLGLQETSCAAAEPVWALTCRADVRGGQPARCALPEGWRLLADIDPACLPEEARAAEPRPAAEALALELVGGLPLGDGAWFAAAPPAVIGPPGLGCELAAAGAVIGRVRDGHPTRLDALTDREGTIRIEAGGLSLDLMLASRGTRTGHGELRWRLDGPARAAGGPLADLPEQALPTIAGAVITGDAQPPPPLPSGPWCRLRGTVWALLVDGTYELVRSPDCEQWQRSVGYAPGARWRLPSRTVWACQPHRRLVLLVDPTRAVDASGPDVAEVVAACAQARVVGVATAESAWWRLVAAVERISVG
jgi:hypothetical protein